MTSYQPYLTGIGVYEDPNAKIISGICLYSYNIYGGMSTTVMNHLELFKEIMCGNCKNGEKIISGHFVHAPWLENGYEYYGYGIETVYDMSIGNFQMNPEIYSCLKNPMKRFYEYTRRCCMVNFRVTEEDIVKDIPEKSKNIMKELASQVLIYNRVLSQSDESGTYSWMEF